MFKMSGEGYEELATAQIDEEMYATPAFMDGRIYIRSTESLFCIGKEAQ
jgi:hypothetical protein